VEYERSLWLEDGLPATARILIQGDLNLFKALKGESSGGGG
jgi:hypothetical protein